MTAGPRLTLLFATALVLSASSAGEPSPMPTAATAPAAATSGHAMHRGPRVVLAEFSFPTAVARAQASGQVRLVLPQQPLTIAENVPVTVVNTSASTIYRSLCFVLERQTARGWRIVTRTHGVPIGCTVRAGEVQAAHSRQPEQLQLYDDLRPGSYRITLYYRAVPKHWRVIPRLTRRDRLIRLPITVQRAPRRPRPRLSEQRLLHLAEDAAIRAGDPHPSLIQHAAGPRLEAGLVGSGDVVNEWNWSYLIAERGHFAQTGAGLGNTTITGSVLTLVVDAATGQVTDFGLSKRYPQLRHLGVVTTDLRSYRQGPSVAGR